MENNSILIADDAEINREMLRVIFEEQYDILEAEDGEQAIQILEEKHENISIILLDLLMPKKTGLDVLEYMKQSGLIHTIPVIMITGESTPVNDDKAYEYGVSDIIYKPYEERIVMRRTKNTIELFENRLHLEHKLEKRTRQLKKSQEQLEKNNEFLVNALSSVVEFRDLESGEHIQRVKTFTRILLNYLYDFYPEYGLTKEQIDLIVNASTLHDIGKIAVSDSVLLKPGRLTKEEFEEIKKHTTLGCELLEKFRQADSEFYGYCYDICRYHHERYDGRGYPDQLKGDEIPIWAQVVGVADVYDALVSPRVYKMPYEMNEAFRMIMEGECGTFSPTMLRVLEMAKSDLFAMTVSDELSFV